MSGLSLEFHEILLLSIQCQPKNLPKTLRDDLLPYTENSTSFWKIFLSWDLGTVFCFLEICQATSQNHASSTAAKMLKHTWSLILSHPVQKSITLTTSTNAQKWTAQPLKNCQMKNLTYVLVWQILKYLCSQHLRKLKFKQNNFKTVVNRWSIWTKIT